MNTTPPSGIPLGPLNIGFYGLGYVLAVTVLLALTVWFIYMFVGIQKHGFFGFFKLMCYIPGIPAAMHLLLIPIEFLSNIILRPFSLAVRLFANMLAGHMLLITFAFLTNALFFAETKQFILKPMAILPFFMLVFLTAFEVLVGFLQAYIFTILTAVFINAAQHPEH